MAIKQNPASERAQSLTTLTTITTNNNLTTFNVRTSDDEQKQESFGHLLASPEGARLNIPAEETVGLNDRPAPKWRYVKADLFDNSTDQDIAKGRRKLRLALSFLTAHSSEYKYCGALINTRVRDAKRGINMEDPYEKNHWESLINTYEEMKSLGYNNVRLSKCYERAIKGKGKTIFGMSVILAERQNPGDYILIIVDGADLNPVMLSARELTDKQRTGRVISTGHIGNQVIQRRTRNSFFGE